MSGIFNSIEKSRVVVAWGRGGSLGNAECLQVDTKSPSEALKML